jgi:hypothetical protein
VHSRPTGMLQIDVDIVPVFKGTAAAGDQH